MTDPLERWIGAGWVLLADVPRTPAHNLALDQVLTQRVAGGLRSPTLRFWQWSVPAVILGRFQSVSNEVDLDAAREMGVAINRRISGGGAMFIEPAGAITYSLYMPELFLQGLSIQASYELCDRWVVEALRELGIEAWYAPLNDITSPGGKIAGAAQARRPGVVLHHTAMAYEMNPEELTRVLRLGRERLGTRGTPSAAKTVYPLRRQTDLPREAILRHLIESFRRRFGLIDGALTDEELMEAEGLVQERYGTEKWVYDLP